MAKKEHEYAFDVKLWAEVRVMAASEEEARKKMEDDLGCLSIEYDNNGIRVESASIEDSGEDELLEVDGEYPDENEEDEDEEDDKDADHASANDATGPAKKPMPEYAFDATVRIAIRVTAATEQDARDLLDRHLDCADANFGTWPNGDPITAEASLRDRPRVYEINDEAYEPLPGDDEECIRCAEDDGAVFERDCITGLWSVSNHKRWTMSKVATLAGAARLYSMVRKWESEKLDEGLKTSSGRLPIA
jgi:hypothetical protein